MPRKRSAAPAYQFHVSGQARVTLAGEDFYLGKHGTPESYARYYALLAEYNANGRQAPEGLTHLVDESVKVKDVVADYRIRQLPRYENNRSEHGRQKRLLSQLETRHGNDNVDTFGPRALEAIRDTFIAAGNCRRYANELTRIIVRVFRHGVSRELFGPERLVALESLEPLRRGQAPDNPKRTGVDFALVRKTLPLLSDTVAAMVRIQMATACRPSELFRMTPADIDRSGEVWVYRPADHKTSHHGKAKAIPLVGDAVAALAPYLFGVPDDLCFITSKGTPWNKDTYRRQITRACKDKNLDHWTPYRIRHGVAQAVREKCGAEAVQALLGHSKIDMAEVYSRASEVRAIEAARALQSVKS